MKEFKINDFLTLKLEEGKTNIYVNGELFEQCKFLMLNIPLEETKKFDEIDSIDEAADILGWTERGQEGVNYDIDPETEFWGHSSNLQTWYEHDYDTRLMHSNLSFPLLRKLTEVGDPFAERVFKKEIVLRLKSGYPSVVNYILNEELLGNLNQEELEKLMEQNWHRSLDLTQFKKLSEVIGPLAKKAYNEKWANQTKKIFLFHLKYSVSNKQNFERIITIHLGTITKYLEENISLSDVDLCGEKYNYETISIVYSSLLEAVEELGLIEDFFPIFLETIEKIRNGYKFRAFDYLLKTVKETGLIEEHFLAILEVIDKLRDDHKFHAFSRLLEIVQETGLIEEHLLAILKIIITIPRKERYYVHTNLMSSIQSIELLMESIGKLPIKDSYRLFSELIYSIKGTELLNRNYSQIEAQFFVELDIIDKLRDKDKYKAFSFLLDKLKETRLIEDHFLFILKTIGKLPKIYKYFVFSEFFDSIKGTELLNRKYSQIETYLLAHLKTSDTQRDFPILVEIANQTGLIEEHFLAFLNAIDTLDDEDKYHAFWVLINRIKTTELFNRNNSQIETQFLILMESVDKLPIKDRYSAFFRLMRSIENTALLNIYTSQIETQFLALLESIDTFYDKDKYRAFLVLINSIKTTEFLNKYYSQFETQFLVLLRNIKNLDEDEKSPIHFSLFLLAKGLGWVEEHFSSFLEPFGSGQTSAFTYIVDFIKKKDLLDTYYAQIEAYFLIILNNIHVEGSRFEAFSDLCHSIHNTKLFNKYFSQIESKYLAIWKSPDNEQDNSKDKGLSAFLGIGEKTGLIEKNILTLLKTIVNIPNLKKNYAFSTLIEVAKEKKRVEDYFIAFLAAIDEIPSNYKNSALTELINSIENAEVLKKYYHQIKTYFHRLLNSVESLDSYRELTEKFLNLFELIKIDYGKYEIFSDLLKIAIENGWVKDFFPDILESINKLSAEDKYTAFTEVMDTIKGEDLINELISDIENPFLILLNNINQLKIMSDDGAVIENYTTPLQLNTFANLINSIKDTELLKIFYPQIKSQIQTLLNRYGRFSGYKSEFIEIFKAIKGTELENEPEFKKWKVKNSI